MAVERPWLETTLIRDRDDADASPREPCAPLSSGAPRTTVWERVRLYVDQHLADPALSAEAIAAATYVSKRQLYRIFQSNHATVSEWIRDRRLERCYRDLLHPGFADRTVAEIAYRWGFTGPSHFSRAFRARYGQCPSRVRAGGGSGDDTQERRYAHLIARGPAMDRWLTGHYDAPPVPGQVGTQHLRVLMGGEMVPEARRHAICTWVDRREFSLDNLPSGLAHEAAEVIAGMDGDEYADYVTGTSGVPAHRHPVDELLFFIGTDPRHPDILGAEVEFCLGQPQETYLIRTTAAVWIPAGLAHCPLRVRSVERPFLLLTVLDSPAYVYNPPEA